MNKTSFSYKKMKKAREDKGLSQDDFIFKLYDNKLEISRQTLSNYETGETTPNANDLTVIADVLGKPITYFFD